MTFDREFIPLAQRFAEARHSDRFDGSSAATCRQLGCGFLSACHAEKKTSQVLAHAPSTSQTPAEGDKEWLLEAIKGTPLEDKIVIVEYDGEDGKIREQIHP